jgi:hypothetical protein
VHYRQWRRREKKEIVMTGFFGSLLIRSGEWRWQWSDGTEAEEMRKAMEKIEWDEMRWDEMRWSYRLGVVWRCDVMRCDVKSAHSLGLSLFGATAVEIW